MIWTMSSVFRARGWWPCKDVPSDKPDSMDICITIPADLIAVSNGKLRQVVDLGDKKTYCWHEKYPIATYLVSIAAYPYERHYNEYRYANGLKIMPIEFYSFPGNYNQYSRINNLVDDMLRVYAGLFGEYPFVDEKYAQVDFLWSGGMEHQTATSYGSRNEALFAHEIAHQWWGVGVDFKTYHDQWLCEGFAQYCGLWYLQAAKNNNDLFFETLERWGDEILSNRKSIFGSGQEAGPIWLGYRTQSTDTEGDYWLLIYKKGAFVLHMLRGMLLDLKTMNEDLFINMMKDYYKTYRGTAASTEDFMKLFQNISVRI